MDDLKDVIIRMANVSDAEQLLNIYAPYVNDTAITFEYEVPTVEEFADRIENTLKKYPYLAAQKEDEILGYAYVSPFKERKAYDWAVETSIYVKMDMKKQGIGKLLHENLEKTPEKAEYFKYECLHCISCKGG